MEDLSNGILIWRSFSHWIGGMGVLVFVLQIMPMTSGQTMHLMRAESPGPSVSKLVPRIRTTAFFLYGIYVMLTVLEIILLLLGRLPCSMRYVRHLVRPVPAVSASVRTA